MTSACSASPTIQACPATSQAEDYCADMWAACCSIFLVFEYCAHDLGRLLDTMRKPFNEPEVKCLMQQVGGMSCTIAAD